MRLTTLVHTRVYARTHVQRLQALLCMQNNETVTIFRAGASYGRQVDGCQYVRLRLISISIERTWRKYRSRLGEPGVDVRSLVSRCRHIVRVCDKLLFRTPSSKLLTCTAKACHCPLCRCRSAIIRHLAKVCRGRRTPLQSRSTLSLLQYRSPNPEEYRSGRAARNQRSICLLSTISMAISCNAALLMSTH